MAASISKAFELTFTRAVGLLCGLFCRFYIMLNLQGSPNIVDSVMRILPFLNFTMLLWQFIFLDTINVHISCFFPT